MHKFILTVLIAVFTLGFEDAVAASYLDEYNASNAAMQKGDLESARKHAEAAWRGSKKENADKNTRAILAYNYGHLVHATNPATAIAPLKEAIDLSRGNPQMFGVDTPDLLLALAEVSLNTDDQIKQNILEDLLQSRESRGKKPSVLSGNAWLVVSHHHLGSKRYSKAKKSADTAITHFQSNVDPSDMAYANAYLLAGISRVAGSRRSQQDLTEAYAFFIQTIELFPPQTSIESFDPTLASAYAWATATTSAAQTDFYNPPPKGTHRRIKDKEAHCPDNNCELPIRSAFEYPSDEECQLDIAKQKDAHWPKSELFMEQLGAVFVGYHINNDGSVSGARILAEAPGPSGFGQAVLADMNKWNFANFNPRPACTKNRLLRFGFVIR